MYIIIATSLIFLVASLKANEVPLAANNISLLTNEICDPDDVQCLLRNDDRDIQLVSTRPAENATLPCSAFLSADKVSKAEWWFGRRSKLIGSWTNNGPNIKDENYKIEKNASLSIFDANRNLVEEYECLVYYNDGLNASSFVLFRLDYSFFYEGPVFSTVFWGSCLVSLIFCLSSFILNIIWIVIRKVSLWWINRSERINRVRSMLEAMEKYKSRQMDSLHENYQKKVTTLRENYHKQIDELRTSYSKQADRFHDYKQAQMETVTQHLDNIRDNYNQQLNRIRDYGSRGAERLVESYERQLNRMRTFTLQHRLKLMRQYKVKQHHINRLLENIATTENQQPIHEHTDIREMLDLQNGLQKPGFSRSASFYSLPDLSADNYMAAVNSNNRFPVVDFKQFRNSIIEKEPRIQVNEITSRDEDPEIQPSSSKAPLLKHHRRKSSNLRAVSSFTDCREQ